MFSDEGIDPKMETVKVEKNEKGNNTGRKKRLFDRFKSVKIKNVLDGTGLFDNNDEV